MTIARHQSSPSLTEGAYLALRGDLLTCRIRPGEKIKILDVAQRLGVNAGAVREALSRLSSQGLVDLESQRGFRAARVSRSDLHDLTRTRIQIETLCFESAVARGDLDWEGRILATFHKLVHLPEFTTEMGHDMPNRAWVDAHAEFHECLVSACASKWLLEIRASLYAQSERYRQLSVPFRIGADRTLYIAAQENEHRKLMEAALARDHRVMSEVLEAHFGRTPSLIEGLAGTIDLLDA